MQSARCPVVIQPNLATLPSELGGRESERQKRVCNVINDKVMEGKNTNRSKRIICRLTPDEYIKIQKKWKASTCRKLSDYVRHILFQKPIVTTYRNESLDDFMAEAIRLRNELNSIGNNFNQAVKKLHTLDQIAEFKAWLIT